MTESIRDYYDRIGTEYDEDRFSNSYGRFIHSQECAFFRTWLPENPSGNVLDMGCGTGRFMSRATEGIDFSAGMMAQAKQMHPEKQFHEGDITNTNLPAQHFDKAFSMHVLMHLDSSKTKAFFDEAYRLLKQNGTLIVDFPSAKRRSFGQRKADGWHGSNAMNLNEIRKISGDQWKLVKVRGILFFPIHRFPKFMRRSLLVLDNLFCRSLLKQYASYLVVVLQKS